MKGVDVHKVSTPRTEAKGLAGVFCTAIMANGKECQRALAPEAPTTFCTLHGLMAAQWMLAYRRDLVDKVIAVEAAEEQARRKPPYGANLGRYTKFAVVYYIWFSGSIKIGTTTNLPKRLSVLPHEELLAVEPGGHDAEHSRHVEFRDSRTTGEWFRPTPKLMAHIGALRTEYGDPMAYWEARPERRWRIESVDGPVRT